MALLDVVILAVLALSLAVGAWRGLVFELLSLAGWVAAFLLARWFAEPVAGWLPMGEAGEALRYGAAFVLLLVGGVFAAGLLAWLAKRLVQAVGLRPADRALGALFGLVRGTLALLALAALVQVAGWHTAGWWMESQGAAVLGTALAGLKPVLPAALAAYLP